MLFLKMPELRLAGELKAYIEHVRNELCRRAMKGQT